MRLFNNEPRIVERIHDGDDKAFGSLYERFRDRFFAHFYSLYPAGSFGNRRLINFADGGIFLDELYQNSCLKLYDQIMTGKMFVDGGQIFIRKKDGVINQLTASLETYLKSIGKYTLLEMKKGEKKYVDFDPIERIEQESQDPKSELDSLFRPVESTRVGVDPEFELYTELDLDNEEIFALVRRIVSAMGFPCKDIFTYTYFNETGKKLKGEDIAKLMGYSSADVVKNQRVRCNKKFAAAFKKELAAI